jgi:predicted MPP superfamily phosphohydrolase
MLMRHVFGVVFLVLAVPSQLFWFWQVKALGPKLIRGAILRRWLAGLGIAGYLLLFVYNFGWFARTPEPTHLTVRAALLQGPFRWWMLSSLLGFLVVAGLFIVGRLARAVHFVYARLFPPSDPAHQRLISLARRGFLKKAALATGVTPFAACAYGILYERTEIETTFQRINLARLPKAFDGIRVAQLSDLHIGPFMPAADIRRCVAMVNQLKPDWVALTGDFITWDASTQAEAVEALRGLKAPLGIWGCLGNHEHWADVEDSITRLFATQGVRILRHENALIQSSGERLNLIGVDFQSRAPYGPPSEHFVSEYLEGVAPLMLPDTVNLLLSHNPNTFDRAAELGIDLSLAGHTHGGQVTLDFISPNLSPSRLITSYIRGWFQKGQSHLYVNRGIGTIGFPMRFDSPPEITVYELKRG